MRFEFAGKTYFIDFEYQRDVKLELSASIHKISPEDIKDINCPNTTICRIAEGNYKNIILTGASHRSASDSFQKETGRKIALTRALQIELDNKYQIQEIAWNKYFRKAAWNAYFGRKSL